jgi:hypothetical protein
MNSKHITAWNQRAKHPLKESSISSNQKLRSILAVGAVIASCLSLSSCVEPNGSNYGTNYGTSFTTLQQQGYQLNALPRGYRSETISGSTYFYHKGKYYRRSSTGYIETQAPRNSQYYNEYEQLRQYDYRDNLPPDGYQSETISGVTYYYRNGKYYRRSSRGYEEINAPRNSQFHNRHELLRQDDFKKTDLIEATDMIAATIRETGSVKSSPNSQAAIGYFLIKEDNTI